MFAYANNSGESLISDNSVRKYLVHPAMAPCNPDTAEHKRSHKEELAANERIVSHGSWKLSKEMKMKRILLGLILTCTATIAIGTTPSSSLEVVLSHPESRQEAESGVVIFTMINRGNEPVYVLKLQTPLNSNLDGKLLNDIFDVRDGNEKKVKYTSMFVSAIINASSYIKINPGETLSRKIDLSKSYDLHSSGPFKVRFSRYMLGDPSTDLNDTTQTPGPEFMKPVTSNALDIWVNSTLPTAA